QEPLPTLVNIPLYPNTSTPSLTANEEDDDGKANIPVEVSGAFLTDTPTFSFTDVKQELSPTCAFAATLSAVARTSFPLASNIAVTHSNGPNDLVYTVRLYTPNAQGVYQPVLIDVPFNGAIYPSDLHSTNPAEYWPTIFQRAYLVLCQETGATVADIGQ